MGLKPLPETPQSIPHPALCSGSIFQREGYIPSFTIFLPLLRKTRSPSGMSLLSPAGTFGLHSCDEINYKQWVNVWLGPHRLHKETMCKTFSSSLFALQGEQILLWHLLPLSLPPPFLTSPCKRWCEKASTQSRDHGVCGVLGRACQSKLKLFF